jgi:hypothetical protein
MGADKEREQWEQEFTKRIQQIHASDEEIEAARKQLEDHLHQSPGPQMCDL